MKANLLFAIFIVLTITIHSQIIRVPTDQPTIQAGIDVASDGDTVLVALGEYFENLEISKSILLTSNFMFEEDTSAISSTIINGSLNEASVIHVWAHISVRPTIQGFTITGGQGTADASGYTIGGGIYTRTNIKIQYNKIINNNISNPYCLGGGICAIIDKNDLEILIQYNNISNNSLEGYGESTGGGIEIYAYSEVSSGNIGILNNIITNNQISTVILADFVSGGGGISLRSRFPVLLSKNIISNNTGVFGGGILLYEPFGSLTKIINNTVVDNEATQKGGGLCIVHGRADIVNSIFWNNVAPIDSCISIGGDLNINYSITSREYAGTNNITENPLLTEDFLLSNNSSAIDAGNPDENFNDVEDPTNPGNPLWPSKGSLANDIGATGGNYEMELPDSEYTLPKRFLYGDHNGIVYRIAKPLNYDSNSYYPMTVYLHEQNVHGTDNEQHLAGGLLWRSNAEYYKHNEFTLVPQNRVGPRWNVDELNEVIHSIKDLYPIDTTRIYLVGGSEGGAGLCSYIRKYPEIIAAGIPFSESNWGTGMKFVPFWILHGSDDSFVSVNLARNTIAGFEETGLEAFRTEENSTTALDSVINNGGRLLYTEYQGADHFTSPYVFQNELMYKWIAKQRKPQIMPSEVWTDKTFYGSLNDTVSFGMNFLNKYEYNVNYTAHISSFDKSIIMDVELYDDGAHGDLDVGDGIWGNIFSGINSEQILRLGVNVENTDLSTDYYYQDLVRFTTAGPIVFDSISTFRQSMIDPTRFSFDIYLKNSGKSATVTEIGATIIPDTTQNCLTKVGSYYKFFGDIEPGGVKKGRNFIVYLDSTCIESTNLSIPFSIEISSKSYPLWSDSASFNIVTSIIDEKLSLPTEFVLKQNYPNPFNPNTIIKYSIPKQSNVTLKVYDLLGSEVATLVNKKQPQGNYDVEFDCSDLTSGIYFYRLQSGDYVETKKMILLK
jgi:predicted esterase